MRKMICKPATVEIGSEKKKAPSTSKKTTSKKKKILEPELEAPSGGIGLLVALEPRIMFDGAALATGAEVLQDTATTEQTQIPGIDGDTATDSSTTEASDDALWTSGLSLSAPSDRKEIVFIDTSVEDFQTLMEGIDPNAEVILLDSTRDGIEQIAEILGERTDIDAVHIISHGDSGELRLGTGVLNMASMQGDYADDLATINQALTDEADFLIYGCNFGEGAGGQEAATLLAELTGADIAASDDLTGAETLGGDWDLEVQTGTIESAVIVDTQAQEAFVGVLDITTGLVGNWTLDSDATDSSGNSYDGTLTGDAAIDTTDATDIVGAGKLSLDGSGDYVNLDAHVAGFSGLTEGTIAGWVRVTDAGENILFSVSDKDDAQSVAKFGIEAGGQVKWLASEGGLDVLAYSTQTVNDGAWHHIAVTVNSGGNTLYIDGVVASVSYSAGSAATTNFFNNVSDIDAVDIGRSVRAGAPEGEFNGLADEVRVYDRALSVADINELVAQAPTSVGEIGHWTFDANANDSSGNNNNGTLTNGAAIDTTDTTDQVGVAKLSLDGTNDYVDLSAHINNFEDLTQGTISAWIKTTGTNEAIFSLSGNGDADSHATLMVGATGYLTFEVWDNDSPLLAVYNGNGPTINDGAWHHVAVSVDASGNSLYLDGVKISNGDLIYDTGSSNTSAFFDEIGSRDSLAIGRTENDSGGRWYFSGLIDDVHVHNRALSTAIIAQLAQEGPVANDDTVTTDMNTAVNINVAANDTDLDGETITVLDVSNPTNGTVVNNGDGTVTYTPTTSYTGADSFTYVTADLDDTTSYWRLDGDATDSVSSNDGTITGTTTVEGNYGDALSFDEVDDKVVVSDFAMSDEFSISFQIKIDDNTGSLFQYIYSHGDIDTTNSLNIFLNEATHGTDPNMLRTVIRDTNDTLSNTALEFDASAIIGDGNWHTYTLTVASGEGAKVYLDGVVQNTDATRGGDAFDPATDIYFGAKHDLDVDRFFGGSLDSVQVFNRALSSAEINNTIAGGSSLGTVNVTVNANTAPTDIEAIATTDGGLSLNEDGGNDAYLIADDGSAIIGGLTSLTAEVRFSMDSFSNSTNFFSYATAGDDNTFKFNIRDNGDLSLSINSVKVNSSAMDYRLLADGAQHTLSVTWNSTGGVWEMFVDGYSMDSGSGLETGVTLAGGGTLVMGNDQDSVDGGYDPAAEVSATLYDARIFNDVRTSTEIGDNYYTTVSSGESGLVANWTFNDLTTGGVVTDTVTGNDLTVKHASGGGFVTSTPVLTLEVNENVANGTVVGTVLGTDPEADSLIYSLTDDASGRFTIDGNTGVITVADGSLLNYENNTSHTITVRISDGSQTYDEVYTINVNNLAEGVIVVDTTSDTSDGDTDSLDTLLQNKGADGVISLREAIEAANNTSGTDTINFNILDALVGGAHTIDVLSALPDITDTVIIDGTSEPDFGGTPIIELDGSSAGAVDGLRLLAGSDGSTIQGLVINQFGSQGIEINNSDGNTIAGNYIGTDVTGTIDLGNGSAGIYLFSAQNNTIGGTTAVARNLISGNQGSGILRQGSNGGNVIQGNYIGTDVTGTLDLGNSQNGIAFAGSGADTIGGAVAGAGNVISGNNFSGISIGVGADGVTIQGNYIGTNAAGTGAIANSGDGLALSSDNNQVGGTSALARNVISGNTGDGLQIAGDNNTVEGNYIGINAAGTGYLGNALQGVFITSNADGNTIGGTVAGARNVISGNDEDGIRLDNATNTTIQGNYVGLNAAGTAAIGNSQEGINLLNTTTGTTIGGTAAGARNVVSGNAGEGILIGGTSTGSVVQGNYIGTDAAGTADVGNASSGIHISADGITVGGTTAGARNIISGNAQDGITVSGASNTVIQGNYIGTDVTGTADLGNSDEGIEVVSATNTTIGGSVVGARNVIAGNTSAGIRDDSTGTTIRGNYIGVDSTGAATLANSFGIQTWSSSTNSIIGGSGANEGNVIGGNTNQGIILYSGSGHTVQGNYIGTDASGTVDLGNGQNGIYLSSASNNLIGGTGVGEGNTVAFNGANGVGVGSGTGNAILGNQIYSNTDLGIDLSGGTEDGFGVTSNDVSDVDTGANNLQNYPVLSAVSTTGSQVTITGSLNSTATTTFRIEFFASAAADGSGYGEAERYLGFATVTTDGSGNATISETISAVVTGGEYVTATATVIDDAGQVGVDDALAYGNTSEFGLSAFVTAAPTDLSSGIELNTDSGNDAYLVDASSGLTYLNGNTGFTAEFSFSDLQVPTTSATLYSNRDAGSSFSWLAIQADGTLDWTGYTTTAQFAQLFDGDQHSVAVTWDVPTGSLQFYVDGAFVEAVAGPAGATTTAGGTLVVGQHLDYATGTFDPDDHFSGTIHDVRFWDDVRTSGEISLNYLHKFDSTTVPTGLVANWRMDGFDGSNEVVDIVSGNNLSIGHAADVGFTSSTPIDTLNIDENAVNGTRVGFVMPTDPEVATNTFTFSMTDVSNNFQIDVNTGEITVAVTNTLDYETNTSHNVDVTVTDADGNSYLETLTISVNDINDAPVNTVPGAQVVAEDTALGLSGLSVNDVDGNLSTVQLGVTQGTVTVTLSGGATISGGANGSGTLTLSGTQADINATLASLSYQGTLNYTGADTLTMTSTDGNSATDVDVVGITVTGVNDAPVNTVPGAQVVAEDTALGISGISVNDVDGNLSTVQLAVTQGTVTVTLSGGTSISAGTNGTSTLTLSGTQADINATLASLSYQGNLNYTGADTLTVTSADGNSATDVDVVGITVGMFVDTTSDVSDGDISSTAALLANKGADGFISLREAIEATNNTGGLDTIGFNIGLTDAGHVYYQDDATGGSLSTVTSTTLADGSIADFDADYVGGSGQGFSWWQIEPTSLLPTITDSVIIDGATQAGWQAGRPVIELTGSLAGTGANFNGLTVSSSTGSTIQGLAINQFDWDGIQLNGSGNHSVVGNFIGTDITGTVDLGNRISGIEVSAGSNGNVIGGSTLAERNIIAGNNQFDVVLGSGTGNTVQGNYLGVDVTGMNLLSSTYGLRIFGDNNQIGGTGVGEENVIAGIRLETSAQTNTFEGNFIGTNAVGTGSLGFSLGMVVYGSDNVIGGTSAGAGNVISGNSSSGIWLSGASATGNFIQGNYIGTDITGTVALGNGDGIRISGGASNNTIGGTTVGARNIISGNTSDGIEISDATTTGNIVQGNYIGTDVTGTADLGNTQYGINISAGATNSQIGGTVVGARNIISGNNFSGIVITGSGTDGHVIEGNYIGTDVTGAAAIGNTFHGINISTNAANNRIGGTTAGAGNLIANNLQDGVTLSTSSTGNSILSNQIHSNGALGIDLANDGVTANDVGDADAGANNLQNFPVLSTVVTTGSQVTINGTFNSTATTTYRIEFFASVTADGSGYGEAERYLGFATVTTDGSGNATINSTLTAAVVAGEFVTATATVDLGGGNYGDSSEFALNVAAVVGSAAPVITNLGGDALAYTEGDGAVVIDQSTNAAVTDADSSDLDTGTLTVSFQAGSDNAEDELAIQNQGTGAGQIGVSGSNVTYQGVTIGTFTGGTGGTDLVITLNANADATAVSALTQTITYENTDTDNPTTGARTVRYVLTDGDGGTSANYDTTVTVSGANDAPVNTVPGAQVVAEDTALGISGLSVNDVDGNLSTVQLGVTQGTVTVTLSGGATISAGVNGSGTLTLSGTQADINATLASLSYQGTLNYSGADTLTMTSTDGNSATDVDTVGITVSGVNDAPVNTVPGAQVVAEDTALGISGLSVNDVDGNLSTVQLGVTQGTVTVTLSGGATISAGANGTNTLTLSGTQTDINATLASLSYQGDLNYNGADTLTVTSTDGNSATDVDAVGITVTAVNDEQSLDTNGGLTLPQSTQAVITNAMLSTSDVDHALNQIVYTITADSIHGTIRLGGTPLGVSSTFTQADIDGGLLSYQDTDIGTTADAFSFTVDDGVGAATAGTFTITVTPVNVAPVITSHGGGASAGLALAENVTGVTTMTATDADGDPLTYSIVGGADAARFAVDASTGALRFLGAPDFENPTDVGGNNVYDVQVQVSDGAGGTDTQSLAISVTDVFEGAAPPPPPDLVPEPEPEATPEPSPEPDPDPTPTPQDPEASSSAGDSVASNVDEAGGMGRGPEESSAQGSNREQVDVLGLPPLLRPASWATTADQIRAYYPETEGLTQSELSPEFLQQLNGFSEELEETLEEETESRSRFGEMIKGTGLTLSAGFVAWMVRGGTLVAGLMASLPAWRQFDPVPILGMDKKGKEAWTRRVQEAANMEAREHQGLEQILQANTTTGESPMPPATSEKPVKTPPATFS